MTTSEEYRRRGFLARALPLAHAAMVAELVADEPAFTAELARLKAAGIAGVPYLVTEAVRRVSHDPAVLQAVEEILGTREWVMWGANIRRATPNQAHQWHVDLESLLWPSITVAIGLAGCTADSATWVIPGTHLVPRYPPAATEAVLAEGTPEQMADFGDGRFYVFDARLWHRGNPETSRERLVLFLHYQRADEPRVPHMLDYQRHVWLPAPAPYYAPAPANSQLARFPWRYQVSQLVRRAKRLGRA